MKDLKSMAAIVACVMVGIWGYNKFINKTSA